MKKEEKERSNKNTKQNSVKNKINRFGILSKKKEKNEKKSQYKQKDRKQKGLKKKPFEYTTQNGEKQNANRDETWRRL